MNDNFSFDGADAADMPLDLSFSSLPLPEGEAVAGFHLPEMTPAQEQAKADSPKLVDEWRQDVQMLDDGGLNGLEERAGLEAGVSLDAEAAEEEGSESFNLQLGDMDSVRRQGAMLMKGVEEREREQVRDRQNMVMNLLRAGRNDQEALKRIAERWGEDAVSRLESANEEERSYMLGMRLAEVLGDGDSDVGFQIYKNTHDLWGKGIVSPEQVWKDFAERGKDIVEREDRMRELREREHVNLSDAAKRYVLGGENALEAEERLGLFNAGVDFASLNRVRRAVSYIDRYVRDGNLFNDHMADELAEILGRDEDARTMFRRILFEKSRDTAGKRMCVTEAPQVAEGTGALAKTGEYMARVAAAIPAAPSGMWDHFTRSLETYRQNLKDTGREEMNPFEADRLREHFRKQGLNSEEIARRVADIQFEREKRKKDRVDIESLIAAALEGGEGEFLESASFLNRVSYKLGGLIGDWAPMAVPYAGWHLMFGSAAQRARMEGANMGLEEDERELRSLFRGASAASVEKIAFGGFGKMVPGFHKIQQWAGRGNVASWRARFASSPKAQMAGHAAMGGAEEAFLEPTAEYIMNSATDLFLNDERGKATFSGYLQDMQAMLEPDQFAALALFSVGMSSLNYGQLSRDSARFRDMLTAYKASGGTESGLLDAMKQPDMKGALEKAVSHLHDAWMEDPQASLERASAAAGERLSGERIESLRELDAWRAAEDAGMVPRVEPAEQEGMFRVYAPARSTKAPREDASVSREGEEEDAPSYTLMDGEQMTAYLQAFVSEQVESDILYTQHLLAGDVTVRQALAQGRFDAAEVITRTVTDEKTGAERVVIAPETLGQMKARADMAMAAIRALEAEGVSYEDAAARMDASLSEHLPLGTLVKTWEEAQERIRTEQARNPEFKVPAMDAPFSNAYVTKVRRGDTFRRVLRYARGNATVEDLMEETMEQAVISWQAEQGLTWGEFGAMLQEAQRAMNELFPEARGEEMQFIHLDAGKPVTGHDAIEAFSKIGRSRWLADAVNHPSLPSWLRKLLNHLVKFLGAFKARVQLGEMVRQAEEQGVFTLPVRQALAVMLDAGNALYRDQQGDLMELSMERARAQAELDAMFGAGVATEARTLEDELAESRKEDEERRKEAEDEARAPENSPEAQEARREREQARVEALGEPDGSGVFNGAFIEVQEGVRLGFIDKNKLTLCPDVPQFKQGADEQTGVVNPIVGAWQRNAAPISVWRREDGSLQVISGRHRFNACTDEDINCTVYDEAAGFDLDWAQTHDVENNIRDGQASLFEIARYVSQKGLTKEEAVERGIFRKGQSRRGVELGMYGCSDLLDALGNELVSPDDAWRVAMAFRNQTEVQRAGLRALMEGKSWQQAFAVMQVAANMDRIRGLAEAAGMTFETDLFGNSHAEEYFARLAQYAAARVSELTREISSISGASRRPETARKYGVDVRDAGALEAVVKDLKAQRARWQNFGLHEDLIKEANDAVMVELGVKTREEVDRENGVLPLEAPEQEAVSADTGMLQLSQDVSRMLDAALARGAAPAEDEAPATNFSLVSIPSGEVITTAAEMRARLKPLQGKVFVNKNTGIEAVIEARVSGKTVGKAQQAQMSVANLKAVGFSAEEARKIHYTAATRIHELFENAEDGRFEEEYKDDPSRAGAYHFFNTVEIEGIGSFDVNVTALALKNEDQKLLYTLELTIENPKGVSVAYPNPDIQGDAYSASGVSTRNLSSYRSFVEKEKASIRKKAVADGTFMKAPNGADTNLTEDQWLSVRTAAFKNWFGDWEHDPQNASKVVDENGEPRVVYHGSHQWFTSFNDGKQRQQSGAPAGTIFANDNREIAVSFADYYGGHADEVILDPNDERHPRYSWGIYREGGIYDLFMNIRNPLVVDFEGRPWLDSSKGGDINALCSKAKESGHDGVIALNIVDAGLNDQENVPASTDYVAFDSVQVKSATQNRGTYDPKNPDITFSIVSAQDQGLFHDGHFEAGNAVITEPGVTFSITALHASPHSFRKFSTDFMGKGEGAQAYGWGLYFAENPKVNRSYMNQFAQDKATWKFREVETGVIEVMQRSLVGSFLPKDALPEAKEDASDIAWSVLGDLVDAARGSMTVLDIVMELHDEIDTNRKYAETYPQEREKLEQLEGFMLSLLDHLDEIEVRTGMPSNYRVELNVEDSELLGWDYVDETVLALLKDSPVEEVRYALERAERRADYRGENVSGKDVYQELFDAFWDGEDGTKQEAQKAASVSLLSSDIKGIRYADGLSRWKEKEEQTYNYVIFDGNDIKITAFADESTGGAWADYEDPTASFSLATRESVWVTLEREAQKNRLEVLRSQTAKALETWRRVCAANDVKQGDGAEAFGRVMAVVASIYKTLPEGYRFGLYPYMRAAENLATRLEDGQVWLSDELKKETLMDDTSERMDAVIDKLLARTLEQADRYAVDQMRAEMVARIKAVQPTKKASGKFNKGKLSAEDYRHLHGIVAMMNTDQEAKEKRMLELEGVLSSNQSTEEERGAAELELKDWHTFGYLAGMGLEQTRACARALALFITTGRTAWSTRLDEERRRTKFKAEKIVEGLGQATPQGGRDAEEDAKASTRTKAAKYLKYGLQSYSQLLNGWKKIPALRGLAHAEVTAIAEANVALRNMKHARDREVTALVKRCFGVQRTKDVARVLSDFKKTGDSGVVLNPLVKVERTVRIAEAREWVGLSFEEREERRKAIRKEYNDRGLSDDKASVPEALIPEMRRQLAELDELVKAGDGRARRRKNITAKEEVVRPGRKGETLKVSRAQAMYAILLYEQAEYVETMRNEGIGEAEVARLREFVGAEGLAFGYGLRELMNRQGKLLARVYEEREGVPFPAVENYFRAVFRADHKLDTKASFGEQTNAVAGGAKYGMLIPRRKHNLHLAWNMDCEAVFQAASAEVENYICTADITARWRGILADKEAAASLKEHMGRHGIDSLRHWLDVIDGAGVMEGGALLAGAQATSRFQSAKAVALLAWNVLTMLKQTSGLMHGMFAGEVGMGSFLLHLGQTMSMTRRMGVFEMMKTEAFRARTNDAQAELVSQLMGYASDQNYTGAIRFSMAGMRAIEKMDVWSNAVSMAALYNAKWSELEEAGKRTGAPMTEDEMHALCMQSVTRALELVAQPLTQSQKSMLGASTGLFAKMACFMSSEVLNKVGMIVSHVSSGNWGQALALYGMMSVAEQTVIALWHALLDDEDEWEKNGGWFGAMLGAPVAMIGGVPMLGAAVEFGYKQATGQRIYAGTASGVIDYSAIYRAAKNTWKAVTGEKEMTFADWAELILLDAKAAAYVAGAGAGSRSKAADSVASWLLSVAGVANLSKPGFKLAE